MVQPSAFYGSKNVAQGKLGKLIYIPAVAKTSDQMKLTGPSPFRELMDVVVGSRLLTHSYFEKVNKAIEDLAGKASEEGGPFESFTREFQAKFTPKWGVSMRLRLRKPSKEDIMKTMLFPVFVDPALGGMELELESFGQGMQRSAINELIEMLPAYQKLKQDEEEKKKAEEQAEQEKAKPAAEEKATSRSKKTDEVFSADYTLVLYEEPEAFLHPSQQMALAVKLREFGAQPNQQVIASSHSSVFASRKVGALHQMARFERCSGQTHVYQPEGGQLAGELDSLAKKISSSLKIAQRGSDAQRKHRDEQFYATWLDTERTAVFFANKVLLVEGSTERVLFDYLLSEKWSDMLSELGNFAVLQCGGKFNVPRYMELMRTFGIGFGIMIDDDRPKKGQERGKGAPDQDGLNQFIAKMCKLEQFRDVCCAEPVMLPENLEAFLGSPQFDSKAKGGRDEFKPSEMLDWLQSDQDTQVKEERITALKAKFREAMGLPPAAP